MSKVAIVAADFPNMKPKMMVAVGDSVQCGQALFEDRKNPGVLFTAPGAGTVSAINRGAKRALQSVVIDLNETGTESDFCKFDTSDTSAEGIRQTLVQSGVWTAIKERPFGQVPSIDTIPGAIFLTCTDSEPLSADMNQVLEGHEEDSLVSCNT